VISKLLLCCCAVARVIGVGNGHAFISVFCEVIYSLRLLAVLFTYKLNVKM